MAHSAIRRALAAMAAPYAASFLRDILSQLFTMENTQYLLGFDIGGTNARSALIAVNQGNYKIINAKKTSIRGAQTPGDIAQIIRHILEHVSAEHNIGAQQISGIGAAIAGQISSDEHTVINAPNLNWHNVNFHAAIHAAIHDLASNCNIRIANDLNAITWGEYLFGAAKSLKNLLSVYVGTGIGAGLIINGKLMIGADNVSGEIGHCKFPTLEHYPCGCGQMGCVEAFAGGKAIEYRILHDIQTGCISREALGLATDEHPTARCIEKAVQTHSEYACHFWNETSNILAMLIANAIAILNPNGILLGGGVLEGCPLLLSAIVEKIMDMAPRAATSNLQFIKPSLHDDAGTLGAALLCLNQCQTP